MSETYKEDVESFETLEKDHALPEHSEDLTAQPESASTKAEKNSAELLSEAHQELDKSPAAEAGATLDRIKAGETAGQPAQPLNIRRELKDITWKRELSRIQRRETAPQRALSRLIHQPVVRVISEAAGKTVSRPSGLLGGSLVAFLGTTSYYFFAKHFGYDYNYLLFLILFFGGFIVGLVLELLVHLATASHRRSHD